MTVELSGWLDTRRAAIEAALEAILPRPNGPAATVAEAMRYAVFGGGKRLRPLVAIAACEACGGNTKLAVTPAAALELIHTYSLVHDDLPAMDDDDLRRGRPTAHRAFGEAAAILAGDALLTLAFEVLATSPAGDAHAARRAEAVTVAARGAGLSGMVGGQIADLEGERKDLDLSAIEWIHQHKTGALLSASAELGAVLAGAARETREALARFGLALGLGFQVADDVLDMTATAEALGKTPGKDSKAGKATYPSRLGLDGARQAAARFSASARHALDGAGVERIILDQLADFAVARRH